MAKQVNPEHFKITGDRRVRVTLEFAVDERVNDKVIMANAADYLTHLKSTGTHKAWGYFVQVEKVGK